MTTSNKEQGRVLEHAAMVGLGSIGWLTTGQVGAWVWPDSAEDVQRSLARRLLPRLAKRGMVRARKSHTGVRCWVLTEEGAGTISTNPGWAYHHGNDLGLRDTYRQGEVVKFLLAARKAGKAAVGPAGLRIGLGGTSHLKGLDGVAIDPETGATVGIVVVRSAHPDTVEKARRLTEDTQLVLRGAPGIVREFKRRGVRSVG